MPINIGVLCSGEGLELAAIIGAARDGRLPAGIKIVITDRDSSALALAREAGLYGSFVPRTAFNANRDGYERRLIEVLKEAGAEALVLANFLRETGPVLEEAFTGRIINLDGLAPGEIPEFLALKVRGCSLSLVGG